jgi:prepilin-type N-terminal cleavage/methylation domain-containing protein
MFKIIKNEKGLTLVELLLVTLLLGLLSAIIYGSLNGIIRGKTIIENQRFTHRTARQVIARMGKEFSSIVSQPLASEYGSTYMKVTNESLGEQNQTLRFITSSGAQAVFDAPGNFGYIEVEYRLTENPDDTHKKREDNLKPLQLVREEVPAGKIATEVRNKRKIIVPIAENVINLKFRFYANKKWSSTWSASTSLPDAIEVTLSVLGDHGGVDTFRTAFSTGQHLFR